MDFSHLSKIGYIVKYKPDEFLFHEGDTGHDMMIILDGKVDVSINAIDGYPLSIATLTKGSFFGEMSLLEKLPRSASVQAVEDTIVLVIDEDNFKLLLQHDADLAFRILKSMSGRIRSQNEQVKRMDYDIRKASVQVAKDETSSGDADSAIIPKGHKQYTHKAPTSHETYLFDKETLCPICDTRFDVKMIRSSKLTTKIVDRDFRQRFDDFEPLWYAIWVCPGCSYANSSNHFMQVSQQVKKDLIKHLKPLNHTPFQFSQHRDINEVFTSYYLAIRTSSLIAIDHAKIAKLWLRLAWLYEDVRDENMYLYASERALQSFKYLYLSRKDMPNTENQDINMLMGELYLRCGHPKEALKSYRASFIRRGGSENINRQAESRIAEVKLLLSQEANDNND